MHVVSKHIIEQVHSKSCVEVLHPWTPSCWRAFFTVFLPSLQGVAQFFVVIYATKILMKGKKINKGYLKRQLKDFGWSYLYGVCVVATMVRNLCNTRYFLEGFYYNFSVTVPGFLTGLSIFLETPQMKSIHSVTFTTVVLEAVVRYVSGEKYFNRTCVGDTLCFMIANAILMYKMKTNPKYTNNLLWFFKPDANTTNYYARVQQWRRILKDTFKLFWTGYGISVGKVLISNTKLMKERAYKNIFSMLFTGKQFKLGLFLMGYVTLYKIVVYELWRSRGDDKDYDSLLAGFIAGVPYYLSRSLPVGLMPITLTLQICWRKFNEKWKMDRWKVNEIFYAILMAILFHFQILLPIHCPVYFHNMIITGTAGRVSPILKNFYKIVEEAQRTGTVNKM